MFALRVAVPWPAKEKSRLADHAPLVQVAEPVAAPEKVMVRVLSEQIPPTRNAVTLPEWMEVLAAGEVMAREGVVASLVKDRDAVVAFPALSVCRAVTDADPSGAELKSRDTDQVPDVQTAVPEAAPERAIDLPSSEQVPETAKADCAEEEILAPTAGLVMATVGAEVSFMRLKDA